MVVFTLTLIRHGETGANKENIIQGQSDVPLSEAGIKQAQLLARRLQNQKYTHVFASDLTRAKQTAQSVLDRSHYSKGPIIQDPRLRERKFGEVEGKSFNELKRLARRANQSVPSFTPSGAETVQQVRHRAVHFFQELCQLLLTSQNGSNNANAPETETSNGDVAAVGEKSDCNVGDNGDSTGSVGGVKRRLSVGGKTDDSEEKPSSSAALVATQETEVTSLSKETTKKRERLDFLSSSDDEEPASPAKSASTSIAAKSSPSHSTPKRFVGFASPSPTRSIVMTSRLTSSDVMKYSDIPTTTTTNTAGQLCVYVPSRISSRSKRSNANGKTNGQTPPTLLPSAVDVAKRRHMTNAIHSTMNGDCPNVSLSPYMGVDGTEHHRLILHHGDAASVNGAGKNGLAKRKSSMDSSNDDEYDGCPTLVGNVLVVSHGGLLREMMRHFVENLGCTIPGGKVQALRISPNTGMSKFTVSFSENGVPAPAAVAPTNGIITNGGDELSLLHQQPKVTCLVVHDKDHLNADNGIIISSPTSDGIGGIADGVAAAVETNGGKSSDSSDPVGDFPNDDLEVAL